MIPGKIPPSIVIIQPTMFCNIDCSYCYLPSRHLRSKMELPVFTRLIRVLADSSPESPQNLLISWHGGEPLAAGTAFFSEAFKESSVLAKHNYIMTHAVQTNGILLSDDFAQLFLESSVSVCVSIDGPDKIHDKNRRYRSGKGTFHAVMAGIKDFE